MFSKCSEEQMQGKKKTRSILWKFDKKKNEPEVSFMPRWNYGFDVI